MENIINRYRNPQCKFLFSGRLGTVLRAASENLHTLKNIYKIFSKQIHHTRFEAVGPAFIAKYNRKYGTNFGEEWEETCPLYFEFLVAIAMYNRLHPKFFRSAPRELQLMIAERLLFCLNLPNLVMDNQITWVENIAVTPTPVRGLRGYQSFPFSDFQTRDNLGLPSFPPGSGYELYVLATGPYGMHRANGALTATREYELMAERRAGQLGSLTNYNELASLLPQTTRVYFFHQQNRPAGFRPDVYGPWPNCPVLVLKVQIASSHKTPTNRANLNTITLVVATTAPVESTLRLTGHLRAIIAHHCTCMAGASTNRACAHILAVSEGIFFPDLFKSSKKQSSRLTDVHRPTQQQPISCGPPVNNSHNRTILLAPAPNPTRRSQDSRRNFNRTILQNFPASASSSATLQQGNQSDRQQQ